MFRVRLGGMCVLMWRRRGCTFPVFLPRPRSFRLARATRTDPLSGPEIPLSQKSRQCINKTPPSPRDHSHTTTGKFFLISFQRACTPQSIACLPSFPPVLLTVFRWSFSSSLKRMKNIIRSSGGRKRTGRAHEMGSRRNHHQFSGSNHPSHDIPYTARLSNCAPTLRYFSLLWAKR